jgi:hypothetical protein
MDQMMDAWEEQLKQPKQMTASHSTVSELNTLPRHCHVVGLASDDLRP